MFNKSKEGLVLVVEPEKLTSRDSRVVILHGVDPIASDVFDAIAVRGGVKVKGVFIPDHELAPAIALTVVTMNDTVGAISKDNDDREELSGILYNDQGLLHVRQELLTENAWFVRKDLADKVAGREAGPKLEVLRL